MDISLELSADLHMALWMLLPLTVSYFSKIQIGFTFLVPAHLGSKGPLIVHTCARVSKFPWQHSSLQQCRLTQSL